MPPKKEAGRKGLILTLPGAPNSPHHVSDVRGLYSPSFPTPVGGDGEMPLEQARKLDKDKSIPLELVDMTAKEAEQATAALAEFRKGGQGALMDALKQPGLTGEVAREEATASGGSD